MTYGILILAVDDDPDDLYIFCEALKLIDRPIRCLTANNAFEALELLGQDGQNKIAPDMIFVDYNMPRMNGRELIARIKSDDRLTSIPVVMHSTYFSDLDKAYYQMKNVLMLQKEEKFHRIVERLSELIIHYANKQRSGLSS